MTKKIFRSIYGVTSLVTVFGLLLVVLVLYRYFIRNEFSQLKIQTELAAQGIENEGEDYLKTLKADGYRITWIRTDGTVQFDSEADPASMENHAGREEIQKAFSAGYGESRRHSATLSEDTLYAARKLADGSVVRISVTRNSVLTLVWGMLWPLAFILFLAMILSLVLSTHVSAQLVKPLNNLDLDHPLENETYEEIAPLLRRMEEERREITDREIQLGRKQAEFNSITTNMSEGMILLNEHDEILSMNNSARRLFRVSGDPIGTDFMVVNHSLPIQELIRDAKKNGNSEKNLELENGTWRFMATPVNSGGLVILTLDMTGEAEAEKMRREFTANVSHELKTPLQSIMGSAELIENGIVRQEDIPEFMGRIRKESARMVTLVNDIIKLSRLDEGLAAEERQLTDLSRIAADAAVSLKEKAKQFGVTIQEEFQTCRILGMPRQLSEIAVNLIDNAIKYNQPGGTVTVETHEETLRDDAGTLHGYSVLTVKDTGLGIPEEDQKHVFERFYRVDKSRSKETGGTGLGLSIVKHAVQMNQGSITLKSRLGEGTEITVSFPAAGREDTGAAKTETV